MQRCLHCGRRLEDTWQKYCSRICYQEYKKAHSEQILEMRLEGYSAPELARQFCLPETAIYHICETLDRNEVREAIRRRKEIIRRERAKSANKVCKNCGEPITNNNRQYCSRKCRYEYLANNIANDPAYTSRNQQIRELRLKGYTYKEIGQMFGLTGQRIAMICETLDQNEVREAVRRRKGTFSKYCKYCNKRIMNYNKTFCSQQCCNYYFQEKREREAPTLICDNCGKKFKRPKSELQIRRLNYLQKGRGEPKHNYCTRACFHESRRSKKK